MSDASTRPPDATPTTAAATPAAGTNGDAIATLKGIPLFNSLGETEIAALLAVMEPHEFAPGDTIIREGEEGDYFYVILRGTVQYVTNDASGQELVLDTAGPGGFFGELSMLTGEKRSVRVRATDECHTLALDRPHFHQFLLAHPRASINVLTAISQRLYTTDKLIRQAVVPNANEVMEDKMTFGQRIADGFAAVMGSWNFIIIQSAILAVWVIWNTVAHTHNAHAFAGAADADAQAGAWFVWDAYPFVFLNLALSFQAAYAAPIIMMSQNRSAAKDRLSAEIDHETNVRAEVKTGQIMTRLSEIERAMHRLHAEQLRHLRTHGEGGGGRLSADTGVGNGSPNSPTAG